MHLGRARRIFSSFKLAQNEAPPRIRPNPDLNAPTYDVAVIGGGSAGLAFSFQAKKLGLSTIVFDFVEPSEMGTKWGLGGTCVNVGCIPKKLMHRASNLGEMSREAEHFGWAPIAKRGFDWPTLVKKIKLYIKSLNFSYKSNLSSEQIPYRNEAACIMDRHTIVSSKNVKLIKEFIQRQKLPDQPTDITVTKAKFIVVATGGRPSLALPSLQLSDKELRKRILTSDDIFYQEKAPGKTLVLGGGYVAVQCAGFLNGLGMPVQLVTRQGPLRYFDTDSANHILDDMSSRGVEFKVGMPTKLAYKQNHFQATFPDNSHQTYDSVLVAIGRQANTRWLNLDQVNIKINSSNGKIIGDSREPQRTSVDNIFALGDVLEGVPQLTGTAQKGGRLLAQRLALLIRGMTSGSQEYTNLLMDYKSYPTTVFSPLQYGVVGLSESEAVRKYPDSKIDSYHSLCVPLQQQLIQNYDQEGNSLKPRAYYKAVVDMTNDQKILGLHYVGPQAGEVIQGLAVAFRKGLTKKELDLAVGIHPTCAEQFVHLKVLKSSGQSPEKRGC